MAAIQRTDTALPPAVSSSPENERLRSEEIMAAGYLPKTLTTTDLSFMFIAVIVFISNAAVVPAAGAAALTYWFLGFLTFLIPGVIVVADLGLLFPGEGSIYLWTTKTFGAFWGFFAGFCHWFPGILAMVAQAAVIVATIQTLGQEHQQPLLVEPWQQGITILLVLLISAFLASRTLRRIQATINVVTCCYLGAILLVGAAGLLWLLNGNLPQADFSAANWQPSQGSWGSFGTVLLALLGVELPLTLGAEIRHQRSIVRHLAWGSAGVMLAYLIGTFGVMVVVPHAEIGNPAAVPDAVGRAFGQNWGDAVSITIIAFFLFNTALYNYIFARMLMVAGLDRRLPEKLTHLNAVRQPSIAILWQAIIASLFASIAFLVVPYIIHVSQPGDLSNEVYKIFLAAVTVVWCVAMLILFIVGPVARHRHSARHHLAGSKLHSNTLFFAALIGIVGSVAGIWTTVTGSWVPDLISNEQWWYIVIVACFAGLDVGLLFTFFMTGRPGYEASRPHGQMMERSSLVTHSLTANQGRSSVPRDLPPSRASDNQPSVRYPSHLRSRDERLR